MRILYQEPGNGFVGIHYDDFLNAWVMHMDCKDWSPDTFKRYIKIWNTIIIPQLKKEKIRFIYGLCESKKAVKFNKLFGVMPTGKVVTTADGSQDILTMRRF